MSKKRISMNVKARTRRRIALDNLRNQLKSGVKTLSTRTAERYEGMKAGDTMALSEHDIKRINDHIAILETRI